MDYFGSKFQKSPSTQTPISMQWLENVQDPTPIEHFWLMQMLDNLEAKRNFIFSVPTTCPKHFPAPLTVPIADTLLCCAMHFCVSFSLFCTRAQGNLATQLLHGCERKEKKNYVLNFVPLQLFW